VKAFSLRHYLLGGAICIVAAACSASYGEASSPAPAHSHSSRESRPALVSPVSGPTVFDLTGALTQGGWVRGSPPSGTVKLSIDGQPLPLSQDNVFFAAFDRDAGPGATLVAQLVDGRRVEKQLTIAPRAWNIEHINVARSPGGPTEEFLKRRAPELARIEAARAMDAQSDGWRQRFIWPVTGRISGRFGSQRIYRGEPGAYHSGLDISTGTSGTPFVAPADGVVVLAAQAPFSLEGNLLMIDHGDGLNSAFLHCSAILVREGESVKQGQVIGRIGATGRATGPHLHWSIKWRDARLDPLLFLPDQG
jgi:murein DD-endopeptidase MepM/ murein hydrolase activator NlpD